MWNRLTTNIPPANTRVIVCDGITETVARYVINGEHIEWIFDSAAFSDIKIKYWQSLPPLPPEEISAIT